MSLKKVVYIVLGCVSLGLGAVGAAVPLLPAFPFLMFSLFCFAKSSKKLHDWFISTKLYKKNIESYVEKKGMTVKAKWRVMSFVTVTMLIGFICMSNVPIGRIVLALVWVFHILYFIFGIKTIEEQTEKL